MHYRNAHYGNNHFDNKKTFIMKFYNREKELALLQKIELRSQKSAQMTFVVGRRRIGKTSLLIKATANETCVYMFIAKKNEALLVSELLEEVQFKLGVELFGSFKTFKDLFGYLMELSQTRHFTLLIDEFQEFLSTNPSIYSDMQNIWDTKKGGSKINLILCGSIYSLMNKIFENSKEPLFGRATQRIHLKSFSITTLKEILAEHHPAYTSEDLLAFYMITGGVAKYVELLIEAEAYTLDAILDEIFSDNSNFLDEGKNVLIDEFGKDYGNYFSILSLIASSKTSRVEMESILEMQIGGFLDRLENDFGIISKVRPILSKPNTRSVKYKMNDNFLSFWFRFIYKYRGAIETGQLEYVKKIVLRDYTMYSGALLEKYFIEKMLTEDNFSAIGTYWEKANLNEIDIVAVNDYEKRLIIAEVKRQAGNINLEELKQKATSLVCKLKDYHVEYRGLSMLDM